MKQAVTSETFFPAQSLRLLLKKLNLTLEMWANAQRDGRPAEYRQRPLFNVAKFD